MPHFFCLDDIYTITDTEQVRQITKVLRLNINATIIGICNQEHYLLRITNINYKKSIINLDILEELPIDDIELPYKIHIYIPLLKGQKLDWIIQKTTELGVHNIHLIDYEHNVRQSLNWQHQLVRWERIAKEAVEQSERLFIPIIHEIRPLEKALEEIHISSAKRRTIAFIERVNKSETNRNYAIDTYIEELHFFFGPEGGFSSAEKSIFEELRQKELLEIQSLGRRILRAETAIIAGIAPYCCF